MAKIPDDKWQCNGCNNIFSLDEEDDDGEENKDYADQYYCSECDSDQESAYCGKCSLNFSGGEITICSECLQKALKETELKGYVVEKIVEKIVEKPFYIRESVSGVRTEETLAEFEKRIMG